MTSVKGTSTRRATQNGLTYTIRINKNLPKEEILGEELREGVRKTGDVPSNAKPKGVDQKQQGKAHVVAMDDPEAAEDPAEVTSVIRGKGLPKTLPDTGPRRAPPLNSLLSVADETPEERLSRKLGNKSVGVGRSPSKNPGTTAGSLNRGLPIQRRGDEDAEILGFELKREHEALNRGPDRRTELNFELTAIIPRNRPRTRTDD